MTIGTSTILTTLRDTRLLPDSSTPWQSLQLKPTNVKMSKEKRVCVIGAGPSGMSVLYHFNKLKEQGKQIPEIVCFDRQSDWGGLWKYSWETGIDQFGEPVHGSMYQGLWSNVPKEAIEYPDYTFEDHFRKAIPSFQPREVLYDYLKGRWTKGNLRHWIRFNHVVRQVTYDDDTDDFSVVVKSLVEDKDLPVQKYDYLIVASGHFSVPNVPFFPGIEQFPGRVMHSHDFRNAYQFQGQTLLVAGSSSSAQDIAIQNLKCGAKKIICCYKTRPMGFKWPPEITERPLLTKIESKTVHFRDGTTADVDAIILCTGYLFHFPFLEERLRLKAKNILYPAGMYKNVLWTEAGNNKFFYIGMQNQYYTFTMFDAQAKWTVNCITGELKLPDQEAMKKDLEKWIAK
ncbi:flavin-containing monooxygenase FMO GS-OX3-like [Stylophora pistillata]|uniref:flavin-containing monooxygenase FMO GS-OX3-like n=1 Tax=Stylophora pistillata TaxID=50429 RepID=UPI000C055915|nr:flavin-containing monooxygenase FMO GS-OX3-like [Stylophora pistillata]